MLLRDRVLVLCLTKSSAVKRSRLVLGTSTCLGLLLVCLFCLACRSSSSSSPLCEVSGEGLAELPQCDPILLNFDFADSLQGWVSGFADYPKGQEQFYELTSGHRQLPPEVHINKKSFFISGNNHSDDLFMFLKREFRGLDANARYLFRFDIQFATNAPKGCFGVGGAPGEDVTLKAGVTIEEPLTVLDQTGHLRMTIDKGNQAGGGEDAVVLGHIANTSTDCENWSYELKTLSGSFELTTDRTQTVWLLIGTDSGFEATSSLHYNNIRVVIEKL